MIPAIEEVWDMADQVPTRDRSGATAFDGVLMPDPGVVPLGPITSATAPTSLPSHVTRKLIGGTSTLGLGMVIERGAGFLANILAARFGGTFTFGAYSLAISTANQISTYAAGGIGATAARFSGKYPHGTAGYKTLARSLAIVSLLSAVLAALALWGGARPIAHLLGKPQLTGLLRWASVSAVGILLLECARGFFVGQRRLAALVLLSVLVGIGMVTLLPLMARTHNAIHMVVAQGAVTLIAVAACFLLAGPLNLLPGVVSDATPRPLWPMLREVWSFGFVQLAGLVGANVAGWWILTLVARADTSLVQVGFFTIASQLRNLVGIAPGLLTEGSYAVMADPTGEQERTPHRVMAITGFAALAVSLTLAALGMVLVPWALTLLYGKAYAPAGLAVAFALAIAVVHMGNAPAAARLTIVSIRATGIINTVWAIFVATAGSLVLFHGGDAWQAMAIYLVGHILSATLVLLTLHRMDHVPAGVTSLFIFGTLCSLMLALLALVRGLHPEWNVMLTGLMVVMLAITLGGLYLIGKRHHWLPTAVAVNTFIVTVHDRWNRRSRNV